MRALPLLVAALASAAASAFGSLDGIGRPHPCGLVTDVDGGGIDDGLLDDIQTELEQFPVLADFVNTLKGLE